MEALQLKNAFENRLRTSIFTNIKNAEKHPEAVAQLIRELYGTPSKGFAFPVVELARDLDIQVIVADFSKESNTASNGLKTIKGYLGLYPTKENRPPRIVVSAAESYGHQRWTVAHELWHYIFHADDERAEVIYYPEDSSNYDLTNDSEEAFANRFATELLMPERAFRYVYKTLPFWRRKSQIAQMFMVSEEAVKRRIRALEI